MTRLTVILTFEVLEALTLVVDTVSILGAIVGTDDATAVLPSVPRVASTYVPRAISLSRAVLRATSSPSWGKIWQYIYVHYRSTLHGQIKRRSL